MLRQLSPRLAAREAANLKTLAPELAAAFARAKHLYITHFPNGPRPYLAESHRDEAVQAHYYAQGRTTPGPIVTWKKPGTSKHEFLPSKAFDVWMISDNGEVDWTKRNYVDFAAMMRETYPEAIWGGTFKKLQDIDHFELP